MLKGPVIGGLGIVGEGAGGKLTHLQVIPDAVTADSLPGAGGVRAITVLQIAFLFAFHSLFQCLMRFDTILINNNTNYIEKVGDHASI